MPYILVIRMWKEGRTTCQFFEDKETADTHSRLIQLTFDCDTYVAKVVTRTYGSRKED